MNSTSGTSRRIPSLDGLRAISILLVIVSHLGLQGGFPKVFDPFFAFPFGTLGVRVFFVISGFLITSLLLKEERTRGAISLSAFYKRRFLRILPAFYFYLLIFLIVGLFVVPLKCPPSTFFSAATFTTRLWGYWGPTGDPWQTWPLKHTWSLSVEEQFYILWPTLLVLIPRGHGRRRLVVFFIIGFVPLMRIVFIHFGLNVDILISVLFITQADAIMYGCLLALALEVSPNSLKAVFDFYPMAGRATALALIYGSTFLQSDFLAQSHVFFHASLAAFTPSLQGIAIGYLVGSYLLVKRGITYKILNLSFLCWLGTLSYSIYLWQQLFIAPKGIYPDYWIQQFPQNLAAIFACALFSYYLVERPFLTIKSRYSRLTDKKCVA